MEHNAVSTFDCSLALVRQLSYQFLLYIGCVRSAVLSFIIYIQCPSLLYNGNRVFPGGKVRPGREADPSPPSSAQVYNRVEVYLYSP